MVPAAPWPHTAYMEILNQEIVIQVIAVLFVPLAVIAAAVFGLAIISGVAGKVVLFVKWGS